MILILLLPGTVAAAADNITVAGQFEGAYADNVYPVSYTHLTLPTNSLV